MENSTKDKIEIMQHYANGGEIEFISKAFYDGPWQCWDKPCEPSWDWEKYIYRVKKGVKFRLPTKEEFEALLDNFSKWNKFQKGLVVENEIDDILFLPADGHGYDYGTSWYNRGSSGYYWSSIMYEHGKYSAYNLYFDSSSKYMIGNGILSEYSVRLVSDEPFEGAIEFNNVYWKPENEEGYFTYEVAINKFQ